MEISGFIYSQGDHKGQKVTWVAFKKDQAHITAFRKKHPGARWVLPKNHPAVYPGHQPNFAQNQKPAR